MGGTVQTLTSTHHHSYQTWWDIYCQEWTEQLYHAWKLPCIATAETSGENFTTRTTHDVLINMISLITFTVYLLAAILQSEVFHMVICLSVVPANNFSPSGLKLAILISCESCPVRGPDSNNWWHFTTLSSPEGLHWHYTENPGGAILRTQKTNLMVRVATRRRRPQATATQ